MTVFRPIADLSIPLRFGGPQPNAFGADPARARALGDTREGASVNFEEYTFTPHCSGTHTECVGHITDQRISVRECLKDIVLPAVVLSIAPETAVNGDEVISRRSLEVGLANTNADGTALIIRTLPNDDSKLARRYDDTRLAPYFAGEAMRFIVECGVKHLLVDLPSIDRLLDEGKLANHRIFWCVEPGSREVTEATRMESTITELIYVPDEVADGKYLLNLQIAPFESDAAPSRPILFDRVLESSF